MYDYIFPNRIQTVTESDVFGQFLISPLEQNWGDVLGGLIKVYCMRLEWITGVSYRVEPEQLHGHAGYEKLTISMYGTGDRGLSEALRVAGELITQNMSHLFLFASFRVSTPEPENYHVEIEKSYRTPMAILELDPETLQCLRRFGHECVEDTIEIFMRDPNRKAFPCLSDLQFHTLKMKLQNHGFVYFDGRLYPNMRLEYLHLPSEIFFDLRRRGMLTIGDLLDFYTWCNKSRQFIESLTPQWRHAIEQKLRENNLLK